MTAAKIHQNNQEFFASFFKKEVLLKKIVLS
jgi:hypothetical protein